MSLRLTLCFCVMTISMVSGQTLTKDSVEQARGEITGSQYFAMLQVGGLFGGEYGSTLSSNLSGGLIFWEKLRIGVGTGYDAYHGWETIPYYGQLSLDVMRIKRNMIITLLGRYGSSEPFIKSSHIDDTNFERVSNGFGYQSDYDKSWGGRTITAMLGVSIPVGSLKVGLWAGYKYQRLFRKYTFPVYGYWDFIGNYVSGKPGNFVIKENLERIQVLIAISWDG